MDKSKTTIIKTALKESGVKQKDIASSLGVSAQFVNSVVNGKRSTYSVLAAISKAVNTPISDLWPD